MGIDFGVYGSILKKNPIIRYRVLYMLIRIIQIREINKYKKFNFTLRRFVKKKILGSYSIVFLFTVKILFKIIKICVYSILY
jgi:hypothetical protein